MSIWDNRREKPYASPNCAANGGDYYIIVSDAAASDNPIRYDLDPAAEVQLLSEAPVMPPMSDLDPFTD